MYGELAMNHINFRGKLSIICLIGDLTRGSTFNRLNCYRDMIFSEVKLMGFYD